jgi:hypothetical protein
MTTIAFVATAQDIRVNVYSAYVFDDKVDSYYDASSYYNGTIQGGFQWGLDLEFLANRSKGIGLKYLRQDTHAPMNYYDNGAKSKVFDLSVNYILLGGNNYFKAGSGKVEPFAGAGLGIAIIDIKNPTGNNASSSTKFAWNLKLGTNIWVTERMGLKLQVDLLSAVQSAGGGLYFGTGGTGADVSTYSTMYQFGLGGGLTFKVGK